MLTFICALNTTNIKGTWRLMPYLYIPIECSFMFPSFVDRFYNGQNDINLSTDELDEKIGENHEGNFLIPWWFWQTLPIKDDNRNGTIIYETYNFKQNKTFKVDNLILLWISSLYLYKYLNCWTNKLIMKFYISSSSFSNIRQDHSTIH